MPIRPGHWPHIDRERLPLDEGVGQYVLKHPLVRSAREHPEIAGPWIVLGLAAALAGLFAGMPAVLLVLLVGLPMVFGARLLARRPQAPRPTKPTDGLRLSLILGWVAAMTGVIAVLAWLEAATGFSGIVLGIGMFLVLPIALKALQLIFRA